MGALGALPLGRRPVRTRVLALYRLAPSALAPLLPAGLVPRVTQGYAIGTVCYTRLGATRLFRGRGAGSDHLAYRFAAQRADGSASTWVARRETSSWLEARCGARFLRGQYGRSAFRVKDESFALELEVEAERGGEFYLRGEVSSALPRSLFASPQALSAFLDESGAVEPHDLFAPEADELDGEQCFAPEALAVFEVRSAFLDGGFLGKGVAELDSAWKLVTRRVEGVRAGRKRDFRVLPEQGSSATVLPTG